MLLLLLKIYVSKNMLAHNCHDFMQCLMFVFLNIVNSDVMVYFHKIMGFIQGSFGYNNDVWLTFGRILKRNCIVL